MVNLKLVRNVHRLGHTKVRNTHVGRFSDVFFSTVHYLGIHLVLV